MRTTTVIFLLFGTGFFISACSLPGQSFPGGPSPWLPSGAPGSVHPPSAISAPASGTEPNSGTIGGSREDSHYCFHNQGLGGGSFRYNAGSIARPLPNC